MNEVIAVEVRAHRRGRQWVAHVTEHGVYGHGWTLKAAHKNTMQGLALIGIDAEVTITPVTPELEKLRALDEARAAALSEAVAALALRQTTLSDIALATESSIKHVKLVLASAAPDPAAQVTGQGDVY